jgi:O-succinylbenzoic acid--CoA ligase
MPYTHAQLSLNKKLLSLADIQRGEIPASTDFEASTLSFLTQWLGNETHFALQTSGSTGEPKKIQVTREQLTASAKSTLQALSIPEKAKAFICLPTQYIAGIMMLVRCLEGNLHMTIVEPSADPLENFTDESFDFMAMVPYQAEEIMNKRGLQGIHSIKKIILGGAPLSSALQTRLKDAHVSVYLTYGMTETLSHIALQKISGSDRQDFLTALPSVVLTQDERGCLCIEAPYLTEKIATNDLVEFVTSTSFRWLGRWDNVINSGGIKLFPEKIEQAISRVFDQLGLHPNFFVTGIPHDTLGSRAILLIESNSTIDETTFRTILSESLKSVELPKQVYYLPSFEYTPTGKTKRKETLQKLGL